MGTTRGLSDVDKRKALSGATSSFVGLYVFCHCLPFCHNRPLSERLGSIKREKFVFRTAA
jgi:hypothetical protein